MREPTRIRTSSFLALLVLAAASALACAKGTEISATDVVVLQALPPQAPDAGADAAAPSAPAADDADP